MTGTVVEIHGLEAMGRQADARADGGERDVWVERERVLIGRRLSGARMRVSVPMQAYRGVVLSLMPSNAGQDVFRVSLVHGDHDLSVTLAEAFDDREIMATWKSWASYLRLPKLVERAPGRVEAADRQVGAIVLGDRLVLRRRGATMNSRRSRRRLLRKPGLANGPANGHTE